MPLHSETFAEVKGKFKAKWIIVREHGEILKNLRKVLEHIV